MKTKKFKVLPGYIRKVTGIGMRRPVHYVEDAVREFGKCCNVDQCDGVVRHWDPTSKQTRAYGVQGGVFGPVTAKDGKKSRLNKLDFMPNVVEDKQNGAVHNLEQILDEQSFCCGADCCGSNFIRLPDYSDGSIYEIGTDDGTAFNLRKVQDLTSSKRKRKRFKIFPQSIFQASPRGQKRVHYFEDIQESMVKCGYYGFECCEGYIFLPDLTVKGDYYRVSVNAGALKYTKVSASNELLNAPPPPPPPLAAPTATITTPNGDDSTPAVVTLANNFPAGAVLTITITGTGGIAGGTETYTVPAGGQTAAQVAATAITSMSFRGVAVNATGTNIELLAVAAGDTLTVTAATIT